MFSSLRARLWLSYFLIVGMVILVSGLSLVVYLVRNPAADRRELQRLRLVSGVILQRSQALTLPDALTPGPRLEEAVQRADNAFNVRVAMFDSQGQLMGDSRARRVARFPSWQELLNPARPNLPAYRDSSGVQWLYYLAPMESGNYLLVSVQRPRLPLLALLRDEFLGLFLRTLGISLALSLLMALWIGQWISAPLQRLADGAQALPEGEFKKIPLKGPNEVKSMARSFNEMAGRLQTSQRAQRDLVANVSHDLKTPLTSIQGFAQAILDGTAEDPVALRQAAQVIYDEAGRMHRMVLDLLDLARIDAGTFSFERAPLDLERLLQGVVQKFSFQAQQAGVNLAFEGGGIDGQIIGDSDRLSQVFSNLVDNALKFTPTGGQVRVTAQSSAGWVETRVEDSGSGILAEELERIFERFYQTDKSRASAGRQNGRRRGTGLGLAIAREIVQVHGGTIQASNRIPDGTEASGSVFTVRLPVTKPDDETVIRRRSTPA